MSHDYAVEVKQAVDYFHKHWAERTAPADSMLGRARRLINLEARLVTPPSEETQLLLDELDGFLVWGRLMLSAAFLDPRLLGLERRRRREMKKATLPWGD